MNICILAIMNICMAISQGESNNNMDGEPRVQDKDGNTIFFTNNSLRATVVMNFANIHCTPTPICFRALLFQRRPMWDVDRPRLLGGKKCFRWGNVVLFNLTPGYLPTSMSCSRPVLDMWLSPADVSVMCTKNDPDSRLSSG
ncbi:hypothetical protein B0H65DRAFT_97566 [Neurospora tetraspora]|uniref:Uncharacterized protein n=1 Tax=Neurospora tetraspora TaxID=94610 RepID=A0AAE0JJU4_9PEZI|nr:hypothetical protein B0H65DRAFT_97566 [Neurospora tetraspora]